MNTHIYALTDPDGGIRYVGKADNVNKRLHQHIGAAVAGERSHKANWIRSLLSAQLIPSVLVLEFVSADWEERERFWIRTLRNQGCALTNHQAGGQGGGNAGRKHNPGCLHCLRMRSPEYIAKVAAANRGRLHSADCECGAHTRAARTTETKLKISRALSGKSLPNEHKSRIRAALIGRKHPDSCGHCAYVRTSRIAQKRG